MEGIAFARSLISDLALDVLLYQSSYRDEITRIVLSECNRIAKLFRDRNPLFKGKVHVMGHSLGSAILFDILCRQPDTDVSGNGKNLLRFWPYQAREPPRRTSLEFEFDVDDFYCLGSPIGLFQMLRGRQVYLLFGECKLTSIQNYCGKEVASRCSLGVASESRVC